MLKNTGTSFEQVVLDSSDEEENSNTDDGLLQFINISLIKINSGILNINLYNKLIN